MAGEALGTTVVNVTEEQELQALVEGKTVTSIVSMSGGDEGIRDNVRNGNLKHTGPVKAIMFKPSRLGWVPRLIPTSSISAHLKSGWKAKCGDCGELCQYSGMDEQGLPIFNFNDCKKKDSLKFMQCPECGKAVQDAPNPRADFLRARKKTEVDKNEIVDEAFLSSSEPEERIKGRLIMHMQAFHPQECVSYGINVPVLRPIGAV